MTEQSPDGDCHYCERTERIKDVEDWETGDVVPACYACRYDFDLHPVNPEIEQ